MFAGAVFAAVAAVMTALKTGDTLLWPCAALLIVTGAVRAFDIDRYKSRHCALNAEDAAGWEIRYQIGAMFYAAALGCGASWRCSTDDPVAPHDLLSVTPATWPPALAAPMAGRGYSIQILLPAGR